MKALGTQVQDSVVVLAFLTLFPWPRYVVLAPFSSSLPVPTDRVAGCPRPAHWMFVDGPFSLKF